jgi:predicted outer membrane repeat protein
MRRQNRRIIGRGSIFAAAMVGLVAMLMAGAAQAATTITVNSLQDPTDRGKCTLRDAMSIATGGSSASGDSCGAGTGSPYTIEFSVSGTITLSSTLPLLNNDVDNVTITGPNKASSAGITISGNNAVPIMSVTAEFATLSLNYLTLTDGNANNGGAVSNGGTLNVTDCTFSGNQAINGGAIWTGSPLNIVGSTFSGNSAIPGDGQNPAGGAIYDTNTASVAITNSTFSDNQALGSGSVSFGGAIENLSSSSLVLVNDTFLGNKAAGATENLGGAIDNAQAAVYFVGTVLANSSPTNCLNRNGPADELVDAGYNIADDEANSCGLKGTSKIITSDGAIGLASALGSNGGPTETIALSNVTGGAYNFIPASQCTDYYGNKLTSDQRGGTRPVNGTCSAGAYQYGAELGAAPPVIDCSTATASNPNLTALVPFFFFPEQINGVNDPNGGYSLKITGVTQDKPVPRFPLCPDAFWSGTTTYVRTNSEPLQPGSGLLYQIQFKATDVTSGASCTGAAPVCVQSPPERGKPCIRPPQSGGPLPYDATKCP